MTKAKTSDFTALDRKCIEELPLVLDVLCTTGNRIQRIMSPYVDELSVRMKQSLKPKKKWLVKETSSVRFYPFSSDRTRGGIDLLRNHFEIYGYIECVKGAWNNHFYIEAGYYFDHEEGKTESNFYFGVAKYGSTPRVGGILMDLKFYEGIQDKYKTHSFEIRHYDRADHEEGMWVGTEELDQKKIKEIYEIFSTGILTPFLKKMKW